MHRFAGQHWATCRPLTKPDLLPDGPLRRLGRRVELFEKIASTNTYLMAHAAELEDGTLALAEFQTAGRGRHGRRWLAPRGSSILLSVLLFEPQGSPRIANAAMIAALAAAEAVEIETHCRPAFRWPNDLTVGGKKLGGVLAESTSLPSRFGVTRPDRALTIGIGLNCLQQVGHFPQELADTATSLEIECPQPIDRPALARRLIERLDLLLAEDPQPARCERIRSAWLARCGDLGTRVTLEHDSRRYTGTVLEIDQNGDLVIQLDAGGRRRFESTTTTRIA